MVWMNSGLQIFGVMLRWYGLIVVASALIGILIAAWLARRVGYEPEHVWRGMVGIAIGGLIGARLWFILFPPESVVANGQTVGWFLGHFFDLNQGVIAVWSGGLGMIGGMIGGALALCWYARRQHLPVLPWLDIAAISLALAQAIGRWGNGANQELYGPPTGLPWGVLIDDKTQRVGPYTDLNAYPLALTRFHPTYAYESIVMLIIFGLLLLLFLRYRDRLRAGDLALIYIALYGGGRALLEFLRVNVSLVGEINISQAVLVLSFVITGLLLIWRRSNPISTPKS